MAKRLHPYKLEEDTPSTKIEEPSAAFVSVNVRDVFLYIVSEDIFRNTITKAISDFENGLVISNSMVDELVKNRRHRVS